MTINLYRMHNGDIARNAGTVNLMRAPTEEEFQECCCDPPPVKVTLTGYLRAGGVYVNEGVYDLTEVFTDVWQWQWYDPDKINTFALIDLRETSEGNWTLNIWAEDWNVENEETESQAISVWVHSGANAGGDYAFSYNTIGGDAEDNITAARVDI